MEMPDLTDISISVESSKIKSAIELLAANQSALQELTSKADSASSALSARLDDVEKQEATVRTDLSALTASVDKLSASSSALEQLQLESAVSKIGEWDATREEVLERVGVLGVEVKELAREMEEQKEEKRKQRESVNGLKRAMEQLSSEWNEKSSALDCALTQFRDIQERMEQTQTAQSQLQKSVETKYNQLWQQVLDATASVAQTTTAGGATAAASAVEKAERRVSSVVSYAVSVLAKAASERNETQTKRTVLTALREENWKQSRKRMACILLSKVTKGVVARQWRDWRSNVRWEGAQETLKKETMLMVNNKLADGVETQIDGIGKKIEQLKGTSEANADLRFHLQELSDTSACRLSAIEESLSLRQSETNELSEQIVKIKGETESWVVEQQQLGGEQKNMSGKLGEMEEAVAALATSENLSQMQKDMLSLWSAAKDIDASKANKRDVDALALALGERDKAANELIENVKKEKSAEISRGLSGVRRKAAVSSLRLKKKAKLLQQMLQDLCGVTKDIAQTVAAQQEGLTNQSLIARAVIRVGGGYRELPATVCNFGEDAPRPFSNDDDDGVLQRSVPSRLQPPPSYPSGFPPNPSSSERQQTERADADEDGRNQFIPPGAPTASNSFILSPFSSSPSCTESDSSGEESSDSSDDGNEAIRSKAKKRGKQTKAKKRNHGLAANDTKLSKRRNYRDGDGVPRFNNSRLNCNASDRSKHDMELRRFKPSRREVTDASPTDGTEEEEDYQSANAAVRFTDWARRTRDILHRQQASTAAPHPPSVQSGRPISQSRPCSASAPWNSSWAKRQENREVAPSPLSPPPHPLRPGSSPSPPVGLSSSSRAPQAVPRLTRFQPKTVRPNRHQPVDVMPLRSTNRVPKSNEKAREAAVMGSVVHQSPMRSGGWLAHKQRSCFFRH